MSIVQESKPETRKEKKLLKKTEKRQKARQIIAEFKKFATKGNVIDMAVGVIVGSAFTKIVNSLVADVINPLLNICTNNIDFNSLFIALNGEKYASITEATEAGAALLKYGTFFSNIINFLIVALTLFVIMRQVTKLRLKSEERIKKEAAEEAARLAAENPPPEPEPPKTKICPFCLSEVDIAASRCKYCTSVLDE